MLSKTTELLTTSDDGHSIYNANYGDIYEKGLLHSFMRKLRSNGTTGDIH